jgi:hypothetical protein
MLGEQPPQQSVEEALAFAEEVGYTARDLALMEELRFALAEEE